jgi:Mrp family chromosome partitioning ATPase
MGAQLTKPVAKLVEIAETKRILSGIETSLPQSGSACLAITSAARGEGKTLITAALGVTAAAVDAKRVLLLDLNWYKPALHQCFGLEQASPSGDLDLEALLESKPISTGTANLDILTAPKADQATAARGITLSGIATGILDRVREHYDLVLIDTCALFPPNRHMVDPIAVARRVHGVVLVVLANATRRDEVKRACSRIDSCGGGGKLVGVVVNQWKNPLFS